MKYVFLDMGDPWMEDEAVAVGPYDTEAEAEAAADGRVVTTIISPEEFLAGALEEVNDDLEDDGTYWVVNQAGDEIAGPFERESIAEIEAEAREEDEGEALEVRCGSRA